MYARIKFNKAAFKHGVTDADILRAIEVIYNRIDEDSINVFHAMPCRKAFRKMVEEK